MKQKKLKEPNYLKVWIKGTKIKQNKKLKKINLKETKVYFILKFTQSP
jgi:hypothetical protein